VLTIDFGLFFIGGGRRQISGINDGHGLATDRQERQELFDQLFIDGAQSRHSSALTKLVKHSHIRRAMPVMEMRKASPVPRLWKQANQGVETVCRG
jgi:inosine/xanthosine triphosphate pyrophosphatase family protein